MIRVNIKPDTKIPVRLVTLPNTIVLPDVDYNNLNNLPTLNGVKIVGDKTSEDFNIGGAGGTSDIEALTNTEIESLLGRLI